MPTEHQLNLLALCALDGVTGTQWQVIARQARRQGGVDHLLQGRVDESTTSATALARNLEEQLDALEDAMEKAANAVDQALKVGARLVTVIDAEYPTNLLEIYNLPPFLFVQGELREEDITAVAVVGTRSASERGLGQTRQLARQLSGQKKMNQPFPMVLTGPIRAPLSQEVSDGGSSDLVGAFLG